MWLMSGGLVCCATYVHLWVEAWLQCMHVLIIL